MSERGARILVSVGRRGASVAIPAGEDSIGALAPPRGVREQRISHPRSGEDPGPRTLPLGCARAKKIKRLRPAEAPLPFPTKSRLEGNADGRGPDPVLDIGLDRPMQRVVDLLQAQAVADVAHEVPPQGQNGPADGAGVVGFKTGVG